MADEQPIGADDVARKQFATAFRGFDQYEVRAFLAQIAAELGATHERERFLQEKLEAAQQHPPSRPVGELDLEAALGAETTRVLHAAREAAAEIRAKAEESVARMLRESNDESLRLRNEAETVLARRTEEAEAAAATILRSAEEAAAASILDAQARGKEMLAEAQAVRERVLKDLQRRRKAAAQQLEQLLAGRQRLLEAYTVVRDNVEVAFRELDVVEDEARLAAETAGLKPSADVEPEPDLEAPELPDVEPVAPVAVEVEVEVAVVPAPAPAPESTADPEADERRSSSLRLLRRRPEDEGDSSPFDGELEGVRLLRPDAEPRPAPVVRPTLVPAPEVPAEPAPEPVAVEPEPEPGPGPEPEPVAVEPEPGPGPEPEPEADDHAVDDLFARLRADRATAVAQAQAVLAESAVAVLDPESDPEPKAEVEVAGDAVFEARDAAVEAAERALTRSLKRALADEQNEVLDGLRRLRGAPTIEALLPDAEAHAARYAALAAEHLAAGASDGASSLGGAAPAIDDVAAGLAGEVVEDLRTRLVRAFDASGGDDEALVETISATYREWKTARSEPLARHGLAAAYALGAFSAAPDQPLRWVVDQAEGGCPDCDDNALAGPTTKGEVFPTGQLHPPAHAGCRCLVLPAS